MQAAFEHSKNVRQALRQKVVTATEDFRSKPRFYVIQSGNSWTVVSESDNRVYGRKRKGLGRRLQLRAVQLS